MVLRFAPSPTGLLHVGNLRTAIINWLFAKKNNQDIELQIITSRRTSNVVKKIIIKRLDNIGNRPERISMCCEQ